MFKQEVYCDECENKVTVVSSAKEEVAFCPFCGEPIVSKKTDDDDEDDEGSIFELDDEGWEYD